LSSGSLEKREELLAEFAREVRQFNGLGASFFRAAASRIDMPVTDVQVIDLLDIAGPATAGRLAELTGLTTGAITGMIDRLEKAGLVRRERDPEDGRRVIVRLIPNEDAMRAIGPIFDAIGQGWDQLASQYDDEQIAFLVEFLRRCNAVSREEITRLREPVEIAGKDFSAPLGALVSHKLAFFSGGAKLTLRADAGMGDLYQARFMGSVPTVKVEENTVVIRYPQRLWPLNWRQRTAEIALSAAVPWQIAIQSGASMVTADLGGIDLLGLEIKGGGSMIRMDLPDPSGAVPIQIATGASEVVVRRPAGVPARVHLKGRASALTFDDQLTYSAQRISGDSRLQSPGYDGAARRYDIEISGSANMVTITTR
jgi:DNA-binding MarR family transcriptional regulator